MVAVSPFVFLNEPNFNDVWFIREMTRHMNSHFKTEHFLLFQFFTAPSNDRDTASVTTNPRDNQPRSPLLIA